MHLIDTLLFASYLAGMPLLAWAVRRRDKSNQEFFLAGRSMGWKPIGLSVMVTMFSAVNYAAMPAEVAGYGLYVTASLPAFILVALPITRVFIPFFHTMQLTSMYEYFQRRFDRRVRLLSAGLFLCWRILWMAVALLAAGRALGAVTGYPVTGLIILAGGMAALYTSVGGMRAVMWTDVAQFFVLAGSIGLAVLLAAGRTVGGFGGIFATASSGGLLKPFHPFDPSFFSLDPRLRLTLWSGLIGSMVAFLARYGADQAVVQRYFSARSQAEARKGFWCNVLCALAALHLLILLGLAIRAHAVQEGLTALPPIAQLAALIRSLPAGLTGLVAAGLLAATMSSIDSGAHACAAVWVTDFKRVPRRGEAEKTKGHRPALNRMSTLGAAMLSIVLALYVGRLGDLFTIINRVIHGLGSPLLALLMVGMFSRRANATGVFYGGLLGAAASVYLCLGIEKLALHYYAVATLAGTLALCGLGSLLAGAAGRGVTSEQRSWTWRIRRTLAG